MKITITVVCVCYDSSYFQLDIAVRVKMYLPFFLQADFKGALVHIFILKSRLI